MYEKIQGALAYPLPLIFQNPQSSLMPLLQIANHFAERMDISSSKKSESLNLDIGKCISIANIHLNNDIAFQNALAANFTDDKIESIRDNYSERLDESEKTKLKNLVEAHLLKYMSIINEQFCKRLDFSNFMYPQGLTMLNQHFVAQNNKNLMVRDHAVSNLSGKIINDDGSVNETYVERLRKFSCLMTLMFYDHKYLDFKSKPTSDEIDFWIALNSLVVDENEKNYISQIYNAEDAELTNEQKALKTKLHDPNFRQTIIDTVKNKCKEHTKPELSIEGIKLDTKIPIYYFEYIMHTPWNSLTPEEKEYKKNFYALIKGKTDVKIAIIPTRNEQTLIESNLDIKNFFNVLRQTDTPIPSQLKIYSKSENQNIVTTDFNQLPDHEAISQKIEDISHSDAREILFALEEKSPLKLGVLNILNSK